MKNTFPTSSMQMPFKQTTIASVWQYAPATAAGTMMFAMALAGGLNASSMLGQMINPDMRQTDQSATMHGAAPSMRDPGMMPFVMRREPQGGVPGMETHDAETQLERLREIKAKLEEKRATIVEEAKAQCENMIERAESQLDDRLEHIDERIAELSETAS